LKCSIGILFFRHVIINDVEAHLGKLIKINFLSINIILNDFPFQISFQNFPK
jgi:hypothetical protein